MLRFRTNCVEVQQIEYTQMPSKCSQESVDKTQKIWSFWVKSSQEKELTSESISDGTDGTTIVPDSPEKIQDENKVKADKTESSSSASARLFQPNWLILCGSWLKCENCKMNYELCRTLKFMNTMAEGTYNFSLGCQHLIIFLSK